MTMPIKVNRGALNKKTNRVADAAELVGQMRDLLKSSYYGNRPAMGDSEDLRVTDERYEAMLNDIRILKVSLDDFVVNMRRIQQLYQKAQENAILRASRIPR